MDSIKNIAENIDELPVMMFVIDLNGTIIGTTNYWLQKLKFTKKEVENKPVSDFLTEQSKKNFDKLISSGKQIKTQLSDISLHFISKNNDVLRYAVTYKTTSNEQDLITGYIISLADLSWQTRVQKQQDLENQLFENSHELANMGSWRWEVKTNKVIWTNKLFEIYEIDQNQFGASFEGYLARLHPDDVERVKDIVFSALEKKKPFKFQERIKTPDGNVKYLNSFGNVKLDEEGNVELLYGSCQDVTQLIEKEEVILSGERELNEKYEELQRTYNELNIKNTSLEKMIGVFNSAEKTGKIASYEYNFKSKYLWWSDNFYRFFGYEVGEIAPNEDVSFKLIHPEDQERAVDAITKALAGAPYFVKKRMIRKNGEIIQVEASGKILLDASGSPEKLVAVLLDVTDREQSLMQIKTSENRFRELFESANDAIMIFCFETKRLMQTNQKTTELLGYSSEELNEMHLEELRPPSAQGKKNDDSDFLTLSIETGSQFQDQLMCKSGNIHDVEISSKLILVNGKKYIQSIVRDITERTKQEILLKQNEERLSTIYNAALDSIWLIDVENKGPNLQFRFISANDEFIKVTRLKREDIYNKLTNEFLSEEAHAFVHKKYSEATESKKLLEYSEVVNLSTEIKYGETKIIPITNEKNQVIQLLGISHDITNKIQSEQKLIASEGKYRSLFDNSEVSIWNEDLSELYQELDKLRTKGIKDIRTHLINNKWITKILISKIKVTEVNQASLKMFNVKTENEFISDYKRAFGKKGVLVFIGFIEAVWNHEPMYQSEALFQTFDNEEFAAIISVKFPENLEESFNVPVSIYSIQNLKDAEQKLQLERRRNLRAQFVGEEMEKNRFSKELHDGLGQMLTAAKFSMGALVNDNEVNDRIKSQIKDIKKIVDEAGLETRRISQSLVPRVLEDYGLEAAISHILTDLKNVIHIDTSLTLKSDLPENLKYQVIIYRVIQEAVNNAVKYSNCSKLDVSFEEAKNLQIFSVSDNGIGFDCNVNKQGLGLKNMRQRVESVGGSMFIDTRKNMGTKIIVQITLEDEKQ